MREESHSKLSADANGWRPVNDETPREVALLFWWVPVVDNIWAEAIVIGTLHCHLPDHWWNGQTGEAQPISHVRYWKPLSDGPVDRVAVREKLRGAPAVDSGHYLTAAREVSA